MEQHPMKALVKDIVYGTVDICTGFRGVRRVINDEPIRFPARWSRYYPKDYEGDKFAFLREQLKPGHRALDIGAHIGLFSVLMARLVGTRGKVWAFEPTPRLRAVLRETLRMNDCADTVEVREQAVSSKSGHASFFDTGEMGSNANSLVETHLSRKSIDVETVSVDDFAAMRRTRIDFLKIDAEGGEIEILEGARETIRTCRPAIQIEVHPMPIAKSGRSLQDLWDLLESYDMKVLYDHKQVEKSWFLELADGIELQILPR